MDAVPSQAVAIAPHPVLPRYYRSAREKHRFVRGIFDEAAGDYDGVERAMALGTGSWYRRQALLRAGLSQGMRVLDVAAGTGLVSREASRITGGLRRVLALDPSAGMLDFCLRSSSLPAVCAVAEQMPLPDNHLDCLWMGCAVGRLLDLRIALKEFHRVLKPGGKGCRLEMARARRTLGRAFLRLCMQRIVPALARLTTRDADS